MTETAEIPVTLRAAIPGAQPSPVSRIGLISGINSQVNRHYDAALRMMLAAECDRSVFVMRAHPDAARLERLQRAGCWVGVAELLAESAIELQDAGADLLLLCSHSLHRATMHLELALRTPLLHAADPVALCLHASGIRRVGLIGSRPVMEQTFWRERLEKAGVEILIPRAVDRVLVHVVVTEELNRGVVRTGWVAEFARIADELRVRGAEAIVLGSAALPGLLGGRSMGLPILDSPALHVKAAARWAMRVLSDHERATARVSAL